MKRTLLPVLGLAALALTACGGNSVQPAVDECEADDSIYFTVLDDGKSLQIDGADKDGVGGAPVSEEVCVLKALGMPDSVLARMSGTTALAGMQSAEWDNYRASWTYHPDNGLDVIVERR